LPGHGCSGGSSPAADPLAAAGHAGPSPRPLTVDVVPGRGSGFSVEAPEGVRFLIRSRLLTEAELDHFQLS